MTMLRQFVLLPILTAPLWAAAAAIDCFRAEFEESTTGASGYFQLEISAESAIYDWSFDVTNLGSSCPAEEGLAVHVHSEWTGYQSSETSSTSCAGAGGHYDPTLGCTSSSSMSTECAQLGRTSGQGYVYACNPTNFAAGLHYQCEIGDISSKLGTLYHSQHGSRVKFSGSATDPFPPSAINFGNKSAADGIATSWSSIVAHCPSTGARLLCAQFQLTACVGDGSSSGSDELTSAELAGIIIGVSIGMAILAVMFFFYAFGYGRISSADSEHKRMLALSSTKSSII